MRSFFITSSGTDIGKTYVTTGLIRHLLAAGKKVRAIKPLLSGYHDTMMPTSDTGRILQALGQPLALSHIDQVSPWRYAAPLSPDMAARREDRVVDYPALLHFCREAAQGPEDILLIEGVGGAFVPLDDKRTVADWIAALGLPAILVAGTYLGTLSHTISAAKAMRRHGLDIAAIVVTESADSPAPLAEVADTIRTFLSDLPLVTVPRGGDLATLAQILKL